MQRSMHSAYSSMSSSVRSKERGRQERRGARVAVGRVLAAGQLRWGSVCLVGAEQATCALCCRRCGCARGWSSWGPLSSRWVVEVVGAAEGWLLPGLFKRFQA